MDIGYGKVMLAGEWAVLELGNPCIVMALDKGITATVENGECDEQESDFVKHARQIAFEYVKNCINPFVLSDCDSNRIEGFERP